MQKTVMVISTQAFTDTQLGNVSYRQGLRVTQAKADHLKGLGLVRDPSSVAPPPVADLVAPVEQWVKSLATVPVVPAPAEPPQVIHIPPSTPRKSGKGKGKGANPRG